MKKLLFATVAMLSASALFAEDTVTQPINSVDFNSMAEFNASWDDSGTEDGNGDRFFYYESANNSTNASALATYEEGGTDKYLNLSTEGGTLWRNVNKWNVGDNTTPGFGAAYPIESSVYIDTDVQFTAMEDNNVPDVGDGKLAIWLDASDTTKDPVLKVVAGYIAVSDNRTVISKKVYTAHDLSVSPQKWYRLTVEAIKDVTGVKQSLGEMAQDMLVGFKLSLDGNPISFEESSIDSTFTSYVGSHNAVAPTVGLPLWELPSVFVDKEVVFDLNGMLTVQTLTAVGFKGTGAIDDLQFTTADPTGGDVAVESITLDKETAFVEVEGTVTLTATVKPDNATNPTVTWTSSDTTKATVVGGVVTGVAVGEVTITAKAGDKEAKCKVTVNAKTIPVTGITLDPTSVSVNVEEEVTITATIAPENATVQTVTWTMTAAEGVEASTIATMSTRENTAMIMGVGAGSVTITATAGDQSATCTVTVVAPTPTPTYPSYVPEGDTTAQGKFNTWINEKNGGAKPDNVEGDVCKEAFLLNVAPNDTAIATAKDAFKKDISIAYDSVNSKWVITVSDANEDASYGNGYITIKTSTDVNFTAEDDPDSNLRFFRAVLDFEKPKDNTTEPDAEANFISE